MLSYLLTVARGQRVQTGAVIPGIGQHLAMVDLAGSVPANSHNTRNINFSQRLFPKPGKSPAKPPVFKKPLNPPH